MTNFHEGRIPEADFFGAIFTGGNQLPRQPQFEMDERRLKFPAKGYSVKEWDRMPFSARKRAYNVESTFWQDIKFEHQVDLTRMQFLGLEYTLEYKLLKRRYERESYVHVNRFELISKRYQTMKNSTKTRNVKRIKQGKTEQDPVSFSHIDFHAWIQNIEWFEITHEWRFKMSLENGCYDSLSCDRIDDEKGYTFDNIIPRPYCLNTPMKFSREQLEFSRRILLEPHDLNEAKTMLRTAFKMFRAICHRDLLHDDLQSMKLHLMNLYIDQGGRCAYSGFPMSFTRGVKDPYLISIERIHPRFGYVFDNIALICVGFNYGVMSGHQHAGADDAILISKGMWNPDYWIESMKITPNELSELSDLRDEARAELSDYFSDLRPHARQLNMRYAILGNKYLNE